MCPHIPSPTPCNTKWNRWGAALRVNTALTQLYLFHNKIRRVGAESLGEGALSGRVWRPCWLVGALMTCKEDEVLEAIMGIPAQLCWSLLADSNAPLCVCVMRRWDEYMSWAWRAEACPSGVAMYFLTYSRDGEKGDFSR